MGANPPATPGNHFASKRSRRSASSNVGTGSFRSTERSVAYSFFFSHLGCIDHACSFFWDLCFFCGEGHKSAGKGSTHFILQILIVIVILIIIKIIIKVFTYGVEPFSSPTSISYHVKANLGRTEGDQIENKKNIKNHVETIRGVEFSYPETSEVRCPIRGFCGVERSLCLI